MLINVIVQFNGKTYKKVFRLFNRKEGYCDMCDLRNSGHCPKVDCSLRSYYKDISKGAKKNV